jgi:CRP/FNR family transcriptional regulator, polysaccharide utilization system transcription regulator
MNTKYRKDSIYNSSIDDPHSIFSVLSEEEKQELKQNCTIKNIKRGEVIFREGDTPRGLICVSSGNIKVYKTGFSGREQIVRLARPDGFIGYKALFAEKTHTSSAAAIEDTVIYIYNKKILYNIIDSNHLFARAIIKLLATEIQFSFERILGLTQKHLRGRIAETILLLLETYGYEDDNRTLRARLSREDIAHLSNMTTSNAIRTLTALARENVIQLAGRKIIVLDIATLEKINEKG